MSQSVQVEPMASTIKKEVETDVEALSSGDESGNDGGELPAVLTTNYHDTRLPMLEDFRGPYNFTFKLPREGSSSIKPTWDFSETFNQVFIKMDRVLVVQFSFDTTQLNLSDAYIRAVLVYSSADHVYTPVTRCAVHAIEDDPLAKSHADKDRCLCPAYKLVGHVLRCKSAEAIYCYDPKSERHSVLCPVKTTADLLYSFRCKNSCPRGIQRRATKLVFTLENGAGKMMGRASLEVKISSCPRRDKDKLEKTLRNPIPQTANFNCIDMAQWASNPSPTSNSSPVMIKPSSAHVKLEESKDEQEEEGEEAEMDTTNLPGEVIMKIRSEVRNIRQVLNVSERRFTRIRELLNGPHES